MTFSLFLFVFFVRVIRFACRTFRGNTAEFSRYADPRQKPAKRIAATSAPPIQNLFSILHGSSVDLLCKIPVRHLRFWQNRSVPIPAAGHGVGQGIGAHVPAAVKADMTANALRHGFHRITRNPDVLLLFAALLSGVSMQTASASACREQGPAAHQALLLGCTVRHAPQKNPVPSGHIFPSRPASRPFSQVKRSLQQGISIRLVLPRFSTS